MIGVTNVAVGFCQYNSEVSVRKNPDLSAKRNSQQTSSAFSVVFSGRYIPKLMKYLLITPTMWVLVVLCRELCELILDMYPMSCRKLCYFASYCNTISSITSPYAHIR